MFTTLKHWLGQLKTPVKVKPLWSLLAPLTVMLMLIGTSTAHAATGTRASAFEYDPVSGLLTKEIIEPGDSNLCLVTTYTYDSFGNKTAATTRNCNGSAGSHPGTNTEAAAPAAGSVAEIVARTSSTTYDSKGQFPISSTNALNQTETKTYNPNFGSVATLTGPNTLTTSWTYDSFGKPLTEARADGTSTSTAYELCTTCPTVGTAVTKYTITTTQAGAPYSKTYYDMEGRAIQSETQDKGGALILSQVQFDKLGRTSKTSRPFKAGITPVWNTVAYDKLNRPVSNTAPNNTVSNITYNGYTTTATNTLSQTKTEIKNSQGQLVTVTDTQAKSLTYQYDAFGNLAKTTDALGNITTITYDARGRKISMDDPDQGVWSYQYDALGQLKRQTDAKLQIVSFVYDKLGRMTSRAEPDLNSTWAYDTCDAALNPAGKCVGKLVKESADNASARTMLYDSLARPTGEQDAGTKISLMKNYDSQGRTSNLIYSYVNGTVSHSFQTSNEYTTTSGHLLKVKNATTGLAYWTAGTTDNEGRVTNTTYGNGVTNTVSFNPLTGRIAQVQAGASNSVSNQSFVYDSIGNITQRYDQVTNLNEGFGYDSLNRLISTSAQAGTGPLTQVSLTYNEIGNIMSKSDIGTYTYASLKANGSARPHAVSKITMNDGVTVYANYLYDANGNMTTSLDAASKGRTLTWTSFNMPIQITGNKPATSNVTLLSTTPINTTSSSFQFVYNASHERVKETLPDGTIVLNMSPRVDTGIHIEVRTKTNGEITFMGSLYAGSMPFGAARTVIATTGVKTDSTSYFHTDHLGSIIAITDQTGAVTERRSYDAWGKRRNLNGTSIANAFVTSDVRHAFTGHEDLGEVGLIHMNGRLYDPATGRFISADPTIQFPRYMQSFNRYSYINNNPLRSTDPSGYESLSGYCAPSVCNPRPERPVRPDRPSADRPSVGAEIAAIRAAQQAQQIRLAQQATARVASQSITGANYQNYSSGIHITLSGAGAFPLLGVVPDLVDLVYTAIEVPFGYADSIDVGLGVLGVAGTLAPFTGDVAASAAKITRNVDKLNDARKLGKEGEALVENAFDIGEKGSFMINGNKRISDGLKKYESLSEVKNTARLSNTSQIRDYLEYADSKGLRFDLYVRENTVLSRPLQALETDGRINVIRFLPAKWKN